MVSNSVGICQMLYCSNKTEQRGSQDCTEVLPLCYKLNETSRVRSFLTERAAGSIIAKNIAIFREPPNKSAAALSGSFAAILPFGKLEIHKVFLRFPNGRIAVKSLADRSCRFIHSFPMLP